MTSLQSTLGEEEGIAEELAESQRQISIAEFFEKNKQMLGFDSEARTEEAGIPPDIYVEISESGDYYKLVVEDNGPGITREQIPNVFGKLLYGSRFHKREQNRGQQGIGISAAVMYSQLTSGKPAKITSRPKGAAEANYFELVIDTEENEPEIREEESVSWDRTHGTRIELEMEANMRARQQLERYIKHTAVVNPHARITFDEPGLDEPWQFERADDYEMPAETEEIRPHPHGVELGTLLNMLEVTGSHSVSGFLQSEFTRVGKKTADSIVDAFRDHYFGREMAWSVPGSHEDADVAGAVEEATANKTAAATEAFGDGVAERLAESDRVTFHELEVAVTEAAEAVEDEYAEVFGTTVRENAVEAAWAAVTGDPFNGEADEGGRDAGRRTADLYRVVDDVTSKRKDDATVQGIAERVATKFADESGPRERATRSEVRGFVDSAAERLIEYEDATFGETARENVVEALWDRMATVPDDPPNVSSLATDRDAASDLLEAMRAVDIMAPPTNCLSPISSSLVEAGLRKEFDADFYAAATRDAEVHAGDPFIVEAGIAYGGELAEEGAVDLMRFANRVPLVYQRGACATTDVVKSIGWRNYNLDQPGGSGLPNGPAVIMVHVASTNVPFTSESKDAVANVPEIEDEVELAIREAARDLKAYLKERRSLAKRRKKQDVVATILPRMAEKLGEVVGEDPPDVDDALARIMNNVLVEREVDDGEVLITVENHTDRKETVELTDIVTDEPTNLSDGANVVEMDGEYFVKWETEVSSGEEAELTYRTDGDAAFDLTVDGVEDAKLTVTDE
ncbi:DNA topoisomerase VI subunit B [Halobacteriales archaeon QS_1_68_20]|nr:MAG: DNA topoisomerase VI subunit B [Halobacteriales archaeon QS_1_68_20]